MQNRYVASGNFQLYTETFGSPSHPACLLMACIRGTARLWSDKFCSYLADQGFFVIRYDHRDIGQSSEIDWQTPYTMQDMADDAISILDGYGIKKAHFVGDSLGGWLCQLIGVRNPERVFSLVMISAAPIEITPNTAPLSKDEQAMMDASSKMFITRKDGTTLEETIQSYLPIWQHNNGDFPLDDDMAKDFTRDLLTRTNHKDTGANHERMLSAYLATMKPLGVLEKITHPTLVIHGDKDTVIPLRIGQALADAIPTSKFVMIKGMGHSFFNQGLEERIAKLVVEHLKTGKNQS